MMKNKTILSQNLREKISLDGLWKIAFDPHNKGRSKKWYKNFPRQHEPIKVPGIWEEIRPDYDGVAWYLRTISIKKSWLAKRIILRFGAVHYFCEIWINGLLRAKHEGGYTPVEVEITDCVHAGNDNSIVVRVVEPAKNRKVDGFRSGFPLKQSDIPDWKAGWYYTFGGIWQPTALIVTNRTWIDDCFIRCDIKKGGIQVETVLKGQGSAFELTYLVSPQKRKTKITGTKAVKNIRISTWKKVVSFVTIQKPVLWDCDNPHLYKLTVALYHKGEIVDTHTLTFGLREFTINNNKFMLNNKPVILKGVLDQGIYAKTLVYPKDRVAAKQEIILLKKAGFNMVRLHIKPTPEIILDLCDEAGILLQAEPPTGWLDASDKVINRCKTVIRDLVMRDRNRTSIVMWCNFNEIGHARFIREGGDLKKLITECHAIVKKLDPTRIIINNSGISYGGAHYYMPNSDKLTTWEEDHIYINPPFRPEHYERIENLGKENNELVYVSEFGVGANPDLERVANSFSPREKKLKLNDFIQWKEYWENLITDMKQYGLNTIFRRPRDFDLQSQQVGRTSNEEYVRMLRTNPRLRGYVVTQWADAASENAGLLDIWRNPKRAYFGFMNMNKVPKIIIRLIKKNYYINDESRFKIFLVNENKIGPSYRVKVSISKGNGRAAFEKSYAVKATTGLQLIEEIKFSAMSGGGKYSIRAELFAGSKSIDLDTRPLYIYGKIPFKQKKVIALLDPAEKLNSWMNKHGIQYKKFHNQYRTPNSTVFIVLSDYREYAVWYHELVEARKHTAAGRLTVVVLEGSTYGLYKTLLPAAVNMEFINRAYRGMNIWFGKHPLLKGLPQNTMITEHYTNVAPLYTNRMKAIKEMKGETVVGYTTTNQFGNPNIWHWSSALEVLPMGRGKIVLCRLRILENLGKDPVADRLLYNMINYK